MNQNQHDLEVLGGGLGGRLIFFSDRNIISSYDYFLACLKGTYGRDCAFVCTGYCKNGCNAVNGKCDNGCDPGWYTDDCNKG